MLRVIDWRMPELLADADPPKFTTRAINKYGHLSKFTTGKYNFSPGTAIWDGGKCCTYSVESVEERRDSTWRNCCILLKNKKRLDREEILQSCKYWAVKASSSLATTSTVYNIAFPSFPNDSLDQPWFLTAGVSFQTWLHLLDLLC